MLIDFGLTTWNLKVAIFCLFVCFLLELLHIIGDIQQLTAIQANARC